MADITIVTNGHRRRLYSINEIGTMPGVDVPALEAEYQFTTDPLDRQVPRLFLYGGGAHDCSDFDRFDAPYVDEAFEGWDYLSYEADGLSGLCIRFTYSTGVSEVVVGRWWR